jgi:hypothetical protein
MYPQMFAFATGFHCHYFIDQKILRAASEESSAQGLTMKTRHLVEIKMVRFNG